MRCASRCRSIRGCTPSEHCFVAASRPPSNLRLHPSFPQVIAPVQVRKGFMAAIESIEDLKLDVPDVVDQLSLFICRWAMHWDCIDLVGVCVAERLGL